MVQVIDKYDNELLKSFANVDVLAIDVEGVDLGRAGKVSLLQIADRTKCLLIDLLGKDKEDPLVNWVKSLLEASHILKVIHDCRMDFDALLYLFDIRLTNVHDTTIWHHLISGQADKNLNDVLSYNHIPSNVKRDKSVYRINASFWATRPLTSQMINWASGDVSKLLDLHENQVQHHEHRAAAENITSEQMNFLSKAKIEVIQVRDKSGFIGMGGANLRSIQSDTKTLIYRFGQMSGNRFLVYYVEPASLERVRAEGQKRFDYW